MRLVCAPTRGVQIVGVPQRYVESRIDSVEKTTGGALRVNATPTAVGVFTYKTPDGTEIRELRAPEEVFHADSLASLEDVPVTIGHPPGGMSPHVFARAAVGHVRAGSVRADEAAGVVRSQFMVARADGIEGVTKRTLTELSGGYECQIDPTPGEWNGQRYDRKQVRIRYDHVAMLEAGKGRMGRQCSLRLDAAGEEIPSFETEEPPMKIKIGDKVYEGEVDVQRVVTELSARADAAEARVKSLTETVARHDAEAATVARRELESNAKRVLGVGFTFTRKDEKGAEVALSDREIKVAVIKRTDSAFAEAGKDDLYITCRYDMCMATSSKATAVIEALNQPAPGTRQDGATVTTAPAGPDPREIAEKAQKRADNLWRTAPADAE